MPSAAPGQETRDRLLEAGGEVFAERGFHAATVREICDAAGANVAAVNYHFGGKAKLYEAVLLHVFHFAMKKHPMDMERVAPAPPRKRLHAFVRGFLLNRLDADKPAWHRKIIARETAEPGPALRALVEKGIRHHFEALCRLVAEVLGKGARPETVELCVASIVGQCVYYMVAQNLIPKIYRHVKLTPRGIEKIAEHVTDFSLAAVSSKARARGGTRKKGRGKS